MLALFATLFSFAQDGASVSPTPPDRVLELELTAADPLLIDGRGPTAVVDHEVEFTGTLHVWARSELDLALRVDDANAWTTLAEDDDSGGDTTPYAKLTVAAGVRLAVLVTSSGLEELGPFELHLVAAPESAATLEAARLGRAGLVEARRLQVEGELDAARALIEGQVARLQDVPDAGHSESLADVLVDLGLCALELGQLESCRSAWSAARDHFERAWPPDYRELLNLRANLATVLYDLGDLAGARALQESVLAVRERTLPDDHPELFDARQNLANTLFYQGDLSRARALGESVLAQRERTLHAGHPDLLDARNNLAGTMYLQGDLPGARALQESVLAARERTLSADHPDLLEARGNLAATMTAMGDLPGARALEESVLAERERTLPADHPDVVHARQNLAATLLAMGDLSGARVLEELVLAAREDTLPDDHTAVLLARLNLAATLHASGDPAGARTLFESVLVPLERTLPADHPLLLAARKNLAVTACVLGDLSTARSLFESVLDANERTLPVDHPDVLDVRGSLAETLRREGDLAGARAFVPAQVAGMRARVLGSLALAPRQAREAVAGEAGRLSQTLHLTRSADIGLQAAVFELQETLRSVAGEAARALRGAADPEILALLNEAGAVRGALNDLVASSTEPRDLRELSSELSGLLRERDRLEWEASRLQGEHGVVTRPITVGALAQVLGADAALVAYRRIARWDQGGEQLLVHVLGGDGSLVRIDLGEAGELEELAAAWRAALHAPVLRGVGLETGTGEAEREQAAGEALRARLFDPILAVLGEDTRRLFVCADDLVFLVPLDALPLEGGRVGDRWSLSNEVSCARLLAPDGPAAGEVGLLALGGVDHDAGSVSGEAVEASASRSSLPSRFSHLLQTRFEAETTGALFADLLGVEPLVLTGKEATKEALFGSAPGKRYVHLATHGWFAPETLRSTQDEDPDAGGWARMGLQERVRGMAPMLLCGLALAGANQPTDSLGRRPGILTAEELCTLDLSQCELAVLSACETNVGIRRAGQGIQSLQAALYAAGARSSITSLWKVDDAATRRLMELFYTKLWEEEMPKAQALWQAKRVLRDEGAPVRDWAGWVLTGDPD